ncbi:MAG: putative peptidoglycan lipid II flippase MurJ [Candidatus Gottesmanbacteria bacterium GW2011_GWA1_43_11]|uniref:Probable lipid II flippase MurJ n=1 Tax=Candidatus Gottesmanbacteria bacterium GW2011_GWA1_43_11 TaxID=1618436 RepID=A0A0G1CFX9_9BACT|nr:MAG: putative peptidoglycan lipid II flippase MurJ [Candidatus Gottesmanbacteria bacterium GW2011_GWA1_43_11]
MRAIIERILAFSFRKQQTILSAAGVIMIAVFLSRVLGLLRDRLLAGIFTVDELGVYFAAFRMPNFIFELLVLGALSTAFIPVFTNFLVKDDEKKAHRMAASIINLSLIVTLILLLPLVIFTRQISYLLVPGFNETERELMISFTRIMLVGQLVPLMVGNFVTGMLQSYQRFILPSLAPIAYNIGIIIGVLLFAQSLGLYAAVWGVVIGAILYLLIQLPLIIHLGYRHEWKLELDNRGVREVMHLMMPRTFGLAISQIDTTVDLILASYLGSRSITIFYFAQHLQQLPIGLFGATFAQAALPTLSLEGAKKDLESFKKFLLASMHQILFLVLPASVILIVLRIPVVRLVFGAARFDWPATVYTGMTLSFFAISIFAQSLVQLFARGFYALYDTRTPVIVGVLSVIINTSASIVLVSVLHLPVWALAISTSAASIVNAALLLILLYRKVNGFDLHLLLVPPLKMVVASLITGIFLYVPIKLLDRLVFDTTQVVNLLLLTGIAAFSGLSVYVFLAWFFDIEEVGTFFKLLQKVKRAPRVFFNATEELVSSDHPSIS